MTLPTVYAECVAKPTDELIRAVKAYAAARNSKDYTHLKETVAFEAMMKVVAEIEGTVSK